MGAFFLRTCHFIKLFLRTISYSNQNLCLPTSSSESKARTKLITSWWMKAPWGWILTRLKTLSTPFVVIKFRVEQGRRFRASASKHLSKRKRCNKFGTNTPIEIRVKAAKHTLRARVPPGGTRACTKAIRCSMRSKFLKIRTTHPLKWLRNPRFSGEATSRDPSSFWINLLPKRAVEIQILILRDFREIL